MQTIEMKCPLILRPPIWTTSTTRGPSILDSLAQAFPSGLNSFKGGRPPPLDSMRIGCSLVTDHGSLSCEPASQPLTQPSTLFPLSVPPFLEAAPKAKIMVLPSPSPFLCCRIPCQVTDCNLLRDLILLLFRTQLTWRAMSFLSLSSRPREEARLLWVDGCVLRFNGDSVSVLFFLVNPPPPTIAPHYTRTPMPTVPPLPLGLSVFADSPMFIRIRSFDAKVVFPCPFGR